MSRTTPRLRRAGWIIALALLPWVLLWPAPMVLSTHLLSAPDQEAVQHLWGLWAASGELEPVVVQADRISWPVGFEFVLIDPGNVPWFLLGSLLGDLDGPFHIIQRWRTMILNGMDASQFNQNVEIYKSITADEVQALAQKYFNKDNFHEVVVI